MADTLEERSGRGSRETSGTRRRTALRGTARKRTKEKRGLHRQSGRCSGSNTVLHLFIHTVGFTNVNGIGSAACAYPVWNIDERERERERWKREREREKERGRREERERETRERRENGRQAWQQWPLLGLPCSLVRSFSLSLSLSLSLFLSLNSVFLSEELKVRATRRREERTEPEDEEEDEVQ